MCGRYTLASPNPAEVRARFSIAESIEVRQRYNVAPGDDVLAVTTDKTGSPRGELLRWGLVPTWAKDPNTGLKDDQRTGRDGGRETGVPAERLSATDV